MNQSLLEQLFDYQRQLAGRFNPIESQNLGLTHQIPLDIESYPGQAILRLFSTYFLEEMWELETAQVAIEELEEAADALHYLIELMLFTGVTPNQVCSVDPYISSDDWLQAVGQFLYSLKKRPAKRKEVMINKFYIRGCLVEIYYTFLNYIRGKKHFTEGQLIDAYFKKAQVNQQRLDSGV